MPPRKKDPKLVVRSVLKDGAKMGAWTVVGEPFAEGAFGVVVKGKHPVHGIAALKVELDHALCRMGSEAILLEELNRNKAPGVPRILDWKRTQVGDVTVMFHATPLLNESLSDMGPKMSESDIYTCGNQLLETLEALHKSRICYCDLKPWNVLWSREEKRWFIIDYGSASPPAQMNKYSFNGTLMFASERAIEAGGNRYDDDIEALALTLSWCHLKGTLPWADVPDNNNNVEYLKKRRAQPLAGRIPKPLEDFYTATMQRIAQPQGEPSGAIYSFFKNVKAGKQTPSKLSLAPASPAKFAPSPATPRSARLAALAASSPASRREPATPTPVKRAPRSPIKSIEKPVLTMLASPKKALKRLSSSPRSPKVASPASRRGPASPTPVKRASRSPSKSIEKPMHDRVRMLATPKKAPKRLSASPRSPRVASPSVTPSPAKEPYTTRYGRRVTVTSRLNL